MFLSKDPSGIYYFYFKGPDGKTKRRSTRTHIKSEALRFIKDFHLSPNEETPKPDIDRSIPFRTFRSKFDQFAKSTFSPRNAGVYKRALDHFARLFPDIKLNQISARHWDEYKSMRAQEVTQITVNIELRTLKAVLNTALRWELISKNPFLKQKLFSIPERNPLFLSVDDFKTLYNKVEEQWFKDVLMVAVCTGMRRSELCNLQWSDIDLSRKVIMVQSKEGFTTKHGKNRVIPMNGIMIDIFNRLFLTKQLKQYKHDYVFVSRRRHIYPLTLSKKFKSYVQKVKSINPKIHFHSCRHSFASWLVQNNTSLYEVQKLLGHSDAKTTMVYSHLIPEQMHNVVNKINLNLN